MKVWIDQDLCTGDGLCEEIAPAVFTLLDDGLAYVKEGDKVFSDPGGAEGLAELPDGMLDAVVESRRGVPRRVHLHRSRVALVPRLGSLDQATARVGDVGAASSRPASAGRTSSSVSA